MSDDIDLSITKESTILIRRRGKVVGRENLKDPLEDDKKNDAMRRWFEDLPPEER
jgi:hypothetical protein